jgi:hypothetical protein
LCSRSGLCAAALLVYSLLAHAFVFPLHASSIKPQNGIWRADAIRGGRAFGLHGTLDEFNNVGLRPGLCLRNEVPQGIVVYAESTEGIRLVVVRMWGVFVAFGCDYDFSVCNLRDKTYHFPDRTTSFSLNENNFQRIIIFQYILGVSGWGAFLAVRYGFLQWGYYGLYEPLHLGGNRTAISNGFDYFPHGKACVPVSQKVAGRSPIQISRVKDFATQRPVLALGTLQQTVGGQVNNVSGNLNNNHGGRKTVSGQKETNEKNREPSMPALMVMGFVDGDVDADVSQDGRHWFHFAGKHCTRHLPKFTKFE